MNLAQRGMLNLFHAYIGNSSYRVAYTDYGISALNGGVVFVGEDNAIIPNISREVYEACSDFYVIQANWSHSFHKSWEKLSSESLETLVFEQLAHYMSTYGREACGLKACPIIPVEAVECLKDANVNQRGFTVIRIISENTAREMVNEYLRTTLAPNKRNMGDIEAIMSYSTIPADEVASFELQVIQHNRLGTVPTDPTTFLRFLMYTGTGTTLLIKNKRTIHMFRAAVLQGKFRHYANSINLCALATVFFRYKPFFLALKADRTWTRKINQIRRLADSFHRPMSEVTVQNFSKFVRAGDYTTASKIAAKATGRQLVKLWNYMSFQSMSSGIDANIYNICNGRTYVDKEFNQMNMNQYHTGLNILRNALRAKYADKLAGKTFVIPSYINYAVPATEKQFVGNIPYGTYIDVPDAEAFSAAIYWDNFKGTRTDIDLHLIGTGGAFGWNSGYRNESRSILYSGDMTDATNGAVEAFYFKPIKDEKYILSTYLYSGMPNTEFKMFLTEESFEPYTGWERRSALPVKVENAIFAPIPLKFSGNNVMSLGMFDGRQFIFYGGEMGSSIAPKRELYTNALEALSLKLRTTMSLEGLIYLAGGIVITPEEAKCYSEDKQAEFIDLSPASLNTRTILDLVDLGS